MDVALSQLGRPENMAPGRCMRVCERCQVGLGIMEPWDFYLRFVVPPGRCPVCGGEVLSTPKEYPDNEEDVSPFVAAVRREITPELFRDVLGEIFAEQDDTAPHDREISRKDRLPSWASILSQRGGQKTASNFGAAVLKVK